MRDGMAARTYGIMVMTLRDGMIGEITGFADPSLFPLFGLRNRPPGRRARQVKLHRLTGGLHGV
jgi:hypothetical protein